MAFTVAFGFSGAGNFSGYNVANPAGLAVGDLRIVVITVSDGAGWTLPAGWTDALNRTDTRGNRMRIAYRVHQAGDPATTAWSFAANAWFSSFTEVYVRPADPTILFDVLPVGSDGLSTSAVAPTVAPAGSDGLLITAHGIRVESGSTTTTITAPAGMTGTSVRPTTGTTGHILGVYSQSLSAAGATGTRTGTVSQSGEWMTQSLVVRRSAEATLPVVASLSADLRRVWAGVSTLPVDVSLTADPSATVVAGVTLAAAVALTVKGVAASASFPVTASITAALARTVAAATTAAVAVGLTVDGTVQGGAASANLPVTSALTAGATVTARGAAAIGVTTDLTAGPVVTTKGAAAIGVTTDLTGIPFATATAGSFLAVTAALDTAGPTRIVPGTANLSVTTSLSALATGVPAGGASLAVVATLTMGARLTAGVSATLAVQITLGAGEPLPAFEPPPPYEVGDVGPTSLSPRAPITHWELLVAETRTGTVLAELPFTDLAWNTPLNDIGTLTATIPIEAHVAWLGPSNDRSPINRLRTVLSGEWKLSLCAVFNNTPIIAGPLITSTPVTGDANVTVGCAELGALLKRRRVRTPGTDPAGLGSDLTLGPTSLPQLARLLLEKATASANGSGWDLPLILPDLDTRGDHVRTFLGSDLADYWTRLSDLTEVQNGPDLRFEPELTDVTGGRKLWWRVRIGEPWLGTWVDGENPQRPPWIFDLGAGLRDLTTDRDASAMTMRTFVPGQARTEPAATTSSTDTSAPQDAPKPIGSAADLILIAAGYPILEDVDGSHTSATEQATLDAWAVAATVANRTPVEAWNVTVDGASTPRLGQWRVGDTGTFVTYGQDFVEDGEHERRIVGASGNAGTDVTLVLTPVPAAV